MLTTRRLAAAICALCLIIPAAASAKFDDGVTQPAPTPKSHVVYGDTKYDLRNQQELKGVVGDTKNDIKAPSVALNRSPAPVGDTKYDVVVPAGKSVGRISSSATNASLDKVGSLSAEQLAAAYGTSSPKSTPVATQVSGDDTNEWRIAAVVEAALLAAFAVGAGVALSGRQRRRTTGLGV
jgi:hypothetical protein